MNDMILMKGASSISERTVERFLRYEEKIKTHAKFFSLRQLKIAAVACVCIMLSCMAAFTTAMAIGGYVRIDLSEIFDHKKIDHITITGGTLGSVYHSIKKEDDIKRFCEMFNLEYSLYLKPGTMIYDEESGKSENPNTNINYQGCLVSVYYKDSSDVVLLHINPDNTFILEKNGKLYICDKTNLFYYDKILYFS